MGIYFWYIAKRLKVLNRLVQKGNIVIVIEHNMEVIKYADYLIDIGPEGGKRGGIIIAEGSPETVAQHPTSETARFLRKEL